MKKLVLDLDDVLCTFVSPWCEWLHTEGFTEQKLSTKDITSYDFMQQFGPEVNNFYLENPQHTYDTVQKPLEGSHDLIEWGINNFDEVMILSHASNPRSKEAKRVFVKKHFNIENIKFSDSKKEKYKFLDKDSILVDDYPYNIIPHVMKNNGYGFCLNYKCQNGWCSLDSYKHLIESKKFNSFKYWEVYSYNSLKHIITKLKESGL